MRAPGKRPTRRVLALCGLLLPLAALAALAQDDEAVQHGIFLDSVDVNLINVEVVVTRDGQPIADLGREDFEIRDDGEPVEITHFYRVEGGRRISAETGAVVDAARRPQERGIVVVLVDHAFLSPASRLKVFSRLREHLEALTGEGIQVMVVAKETDVEVVQPLTTDPEEIEATLTRLEQRGGSGPLNVAETRRLMRSIEQGARPDRGDLPGVTGDEAADIGSLQDFDPGEQDAQATFAALRTHAAEQSLRVRQSTGVIRAFLSSMAGLPGKKAVLYVADSLPLHPGEMLFRMWFQKYGRRYGGDLGASTIDATIQEFDVSSDVLDLIADASSSRVAFYPVGASSSLVQSGLSAANRGGIEEANLGTFNTTSPASGLLFLSRGTGGQAAVETADVGWLFEQIRDDLTTYYSLGYPSPHRGDGRSHSIKVRVKRPGVEVRYLESYRDKSPDQEMSDATVAALYLDTEANPLDVQVQLGDAERAKNGQFLLPLEIRFPLANLVLLPEEEAHVGNLSIFLVVKDERGRMSQPTKVPVPVRIPNTSLMQAMLQLGSYNTKLAMRPGEHTIAVGVRDDVGAQSSTINVSVQVGGGGKG